MTETLWMNEAYRALFDSSRLGPQHLGLSSDRKIHGVSVQFSQHVPERSTKARWVPPTGDQFCEYGPEDEVWMRPLGIGTVVIEDAGPCYFKVQEPSFPVTLPDADFPPLRESLNDAMIRFRHRLEGDLLNALAVPSAVYHNVTS